VITKLRGSDGCGRGAFFLSAMAADDVFFDGVNIWVDRPPR
jgi:hypothetical protein